MSINSLANAAAARHVATMPFGTTPNTMRQIAHASGKSPTLKSLVVPGHRLQLRLRMSRATWRPT
jgi:hypothetical protein